MSLKSMHIGIAVVSSVVVFGGCIIWMQERRPPILEIYVFSLRGGQAMLIRTPHDRRILVGGGSNSEVIRHLSTVLPFYSRHIDAVVAVDTESKNVSGLIDVVARYDVGQVYIPAVTLRSFDTASTTDATTDSVPNGAVDNVIDSPYRVFIDELAHGNIPVQMIGAGDTIEDQDISIEVLFPAQTIDFEYSRASAPLVVLAVSYKGYTIYSMSDATIKIQRHIASMIASSSSHTQANAHGSVLVVSHAAGASDLASEFVETIRPAYLIYSKNSSSIRSTAHSSKTVRNPLATIMPANQFNLKEKGMVAITIDDELYIQ